MHSSLLCPAWPAQQQPRDQRLHVARRRALLPVQPRQAKIDKGAAEIQPRRRLRGGDMRVYLCGRLSKPGGAHHEQ